MSTFVRGLVLLVPCNLFPTGNCWGLSEHQQQDTLPGFRIIPKKYSHCVVFRVATIYCISFTVDLTMTGEAKPAASVVVVWKNFNMAVMQNGFRYLGT